MQYVKSDRNNICLLFVLKTFVVHQNGNECAPEYLKDGKSDQIIIYLINCLFFPGGQS